MLAKHSAINKASYRFDGDRSQPCRSGPPCSAAGPSTQTPAPTAQQQGTQRPTMRQALSEAQLQLDQARQQRDQYQLRLAELATTAEQVEMRQELARNLDQLPDSL